MQVRYAVAKKLLLGSNYKIWKWESNHHLKLLTHVKLSKFELNFHSNFAFMVIFIYIFFVNLSRIIIIFINVLLLLYKRVGIRRNEV